LKKDLLKFLSAGIDHQTIFPKIGGKMVQIIDPNEPGKKSLSDFLEDKLPDNLRREVITEDPRNFRQLFQSRPVVEYLFYRVEFENNTIVAKISVSSPNTLVVFDRSFKDIFVELSDMYERYNLDVTITVVVADG